VQLPFDKENQLLKFFPTHVGGFQLPNTSELAPRISNVILEREKQESGVQRSNMGGWHSDDQLLNWPELQFADLGDTFRSAVSHMIAATSGVARFNVRLTMAAWANVNRAGTSNSVHIHPDNHWSGVLYVKSPNFFTDPLKNAGAIQFQDPRGAINMLKTPGLSDNVACAPEVGRILVFPSWLYHSVSPFSLDEVRISIAFNARISEFKEIKD
jgi:uncharacterized protein (TIGR02466 family)